MRTPPGLKLPQVAHAPQLKWLWRALLLVGGVIFTAAIGWLTKTVVIPMMNNSHVRVRTVVVQAQPHLPMYFPVIPDAIHARQEQWLSFGQAGQLAGPLPKVGTHVTAGEILARLKLSPQLQNPLDKAQAALLAATRKHVDAQTQLKKLAALKQAALGDLRAAQDRAKALHQKMPAAHRHRGGAHHTKHDMAAAKKRLATLDKKAQGLTVELKKTADALAQAQEQVKNLEAGLGGTVLRAPFDGDITVVKQPSGKSIAAHAPVLLVQDRSHVRVMFRMDDLGTLKKGDQIMVTVGDRPPMPGMLYDVQTINAAYQLTADLPDTNGALMGANPNSFRLVRGFAPLAFLVPLDALVGHDDQVALWLVQGTHLVRQKVQVLEVRGTAVMVWDATATMAREIHVVRSREDGHMITTLTEDTEVVAVD